MSDKVVAAMRARREAAIEAAIRAEEEARKAEAKARRAEKRKKADE